MVKIVVITEKSSLANFLKSKLQSISENSSYVHYKSIPPTLEDANVVFLDERIARRGFKKEYRNLVSLRRKIPDAKIVLIGEEDVWSRMKSKIDGAFDYLSVQSFTSELIEEYLTKVVLN